MHASSVDCINVHHVVHYITYHNLVVITPCSDSSSLLQGLGNYAKAITTADILVKDRLRPLLDLDQLTMSKNSTNQTAELELMS